VMHKANDEVLLVSQTVGGTSDKPAPCRPTGTSYTLNPGTYFGGIRIGAAADGTCVPSTGTGINVTMNPGVYVIAGGGFYVCGSANLSAPNVMIFNGVDTNPHTGPYGDLGQVLINTNGSVDLGPMTSGVYQGLTVYQDPGYSDPLNINKKCDMRAPEDADI